MAQYKLNKAHWKGSQGWRARLRESENPRQAFQLTRFRTVSELDVCLYRGGATSGGQDSRLS